jgi:HlyD family secretion protein
MKTLRESNLVSQQEFEQLEQRYNDVKVRAQINKERFDLLESGRFPLVIR